MQIFGALFLLGSLVVQHSHRHFKVAKRNLSTSFYGTLSKAKTLYFLLCHSEQSGSSLLPYVTLSKAKSPKRYG